MEPRILTVGTPKARIFEVEKLFALVRGILRVDRVFGM
jgi:hypothetical protein